MAVVRTEHEKKFDRQIRLWGVHGQAQLESTHVCVLNANATASETLKNLCLANIKAFTLVDDAVVCAADLGSNFFCDTDALGKPRAQCVRDLLLEMNPDVVGGVEIRSVAQTIRENVEFFARFQMVIACNVLDVAALHTLAAFLYERHIPLLVVRAYGQLGYVRVALDEHNIIESKPDREHNDTLHVHASQLAAFPELRTAAAHIAERMHIGAVDGGNAAAPPPAAVVDMDSIEHSHVPFALLLAAHVDAFARAHGGRTPSSTHAGDREAFEASLRATTAAYQQRESARSGRASAATEQNFDEALAHAYKAVNAPRVADEVRAVLDAARALSVPLPLRTIAMPSSSSSRMAVSPTNVGGGSAGDVDDNDDEADALISDASLFWIAARALADFVDCAAESGGCLPVSGDIPDMHADSASYAALKKIYHDKHLQHVAAVRARAQAHLAASLAASAQSAVSTASSSSSSPTLVALRARLDATCERAVRHCRAMRTVCARSLAAEWAPHSARLSDLVEAFAAADEMGGDDDGDHDDNQAAAADGDADDGAPPKAPAPMHWVLALRAVDLFYARHAHLPGTQSHTHAAASFRDAADAEELETLARAHLGELGFGGTDEDSVPMPALVSACFREVVRWAGAELHTIAAAVGGVAAQEALKLIVRQYVPLNNTFVFDGVFARAAVLEL